MKNEKSSTQFLHSMPQFVMKALLKKSLFKGLFMFLFKKEFNASFKRDIELKTYISDFWVFSLDKVHLLKLILLVTKHTILVVLQEIQGSNDCKSLIPLSDKVVHKIQM